MFSMDSSSATLTGKPACSPTRNTSTTAITMRSFRVSWPTSLLSKQPLPAASCSGFRSEERRVGKECRCRWGRDHYIKRWDETTIHRLSLVGVGKIANEAERDVVYWY